MTTDLPQWESVTMTRTDDGTWTVVATSEGGTVTTHGVTKFAGGIDGHLYTAGPACSAWDTIVPLILGPIHISHPVRVEASAADG